MRGGPDIYPNGYDLDPRVSALIGRKARALAGSGTFRGHEEADLRQELALHVVARMRGHDPSRASAATFAGRVLETGAADLARHARAAKRDRRREGELVEDAPERQRDASRRQALELGRLDLGIDVSGALARLPEGVLRFARLLTEFDLAEAARRSGLSRQRARTLARALAAVLREHEPPRPRRKKVRRANQPARRPRT